MRPTVRVRRHLNSETIRLPEVRDLIGHDVEIVISEVQSDAGQEADFPLRGSVLKYEDPFEPV